MLTSRSAVALLLVSCTCNDAEHVTIDGSDIANDATRDVEVAEESENGELDGEVPPLCALESLRDRFLIKNPDDASEDEIWIAVLSSGYVVGRNVLGPAASSVCFELRWRLEQCSERSALLTIDGCPETSALLVAAEVGDDSPPTIRLNGVKFERWGWAGPSQLDGTCVEYACDIFPAIPAP